MPRSALTKLVPSELIQQRILVVRGKRALLDADPQWLAKASPVFTEQCVAMLASVLRS
jgi:hypothetical protein